MSKQLSKHFHSDEFICKGNERGVCDCKGAEVNMHPHLINILELVRAHFDKPVRVTSGYRCPKYNRSSYVGSNDRSQHTKNTAADIVVDDVEASEVQEFLKDIVGGLGVYPEFTHVDVRPRNARW